jgi:hypothetical protein
MVLRILSIVASMRSTAVAVSFDAQSGTQSEVINITKGFHCFDKGAHRDYSPHLSECARKND